MQGIETTDDDGMVIVGIVIVIVEIKEVVGVREVVDMSILINTQVRPVSPVSSLT